MNSPNLYSKYTETMPRDYFGRFEALYLNHIYERVKVRCPEAINIAADFMCKTSRGFGHNRFRSKMSRQLKHVCLSKVQKINILETILTRFANGDIDEQFIEQLRFALWLDREQTIEVAKKLKHSEREYIRRYANRLLSLGVSNVY